VVLLNQQRTLAERLSGAFILLGALVAGAFLLTALAYGIGSAWLTPELERSRQAEKAEASSYAAMMDQERALRDYLATHDERSLQASVQAQSRLLRANQTLSSTAGGISALAPTLIETRLAEERWRAEWVDPSTDLHATDGAPSIAAGKLLFEAYRRKQAAFAAAIEAHTGHLARREQRLIACRVVLELSVFVAVLLLVIRQHGALRDAVVTPIAALLRHIRRIRDGQLEAALDRNAPRELAELAEGLNEVVRALVSARESAACRDGALSDHSIRLHQIFDASREFSESLNLTYVVDSVRTSTAAIGGYERVVVWLMDDEQKRLVDSQENAAESTVDAPVEIGQGLAGRAAKAGRTTFESSTGQVRFSNDDRERVRAIAIPLIVGARVVGVLEARHLEAQVATKEVLEIIEMLATHAATAIESARLHEVIEERSQVDALTRLLNRRRLEEDLDAECKRCGRYGRPLAFVMLDVDHFKAFNDSHGHPKADTALQAVAEVIEGCTRATDTAYRYGGEEFCILLRETTAEDAMHFAERLRQRIEQRFESGELQGITASFGVADFRTETPTPRALVEAADAAMYESKHAGRNRVALSLRPLFSALAPGPATS
jgi:diguanylate cyclase (GGDEF)-like protein